MLDIFEGIGWLALTAKNSAFLELGVDVGRLRFEKISWASMYYISHQIRKRFTIAYKNDANGLEGNPNHTKRFT